MGGNPPPIWSSPPPKKSHAATIVVVVVVAVVALVGAAVGIEAFDHSGPGGSNPLAPPAQITETSWTFSSCWTPSSGPGTQVQEGATFTVTIALSYTGFLGLGSCTVDSVSVDTPGFVLMGSNAPLTVAAGQTLDFTVEVQAPHASYTGPLDLSVQAQ